MAGERTANYTVAAAAYEEALKYKPDDEILKYGSCQHVCLDATALIGHMLVDCAHRIKLAEVHATYLKPNKAIALIQPLAGHRPELWTKLLRYKNWACHWDQADLVQSVARKSMYQCIEKVRSEEHTSELQSIMRISYAVFCLKKKKK